MKTSILLLSLACLALCIGLRQNDSPTDLQRYCFDVSVEEIDMGFVNCGQEVVVVELKNNSNQSRRLLAVEAMCDSQCCYGPLDGIGTAVIPANQTYLLSLKILINRPGPFLAPVKIYLEDYGTRTVKIEVSGEGLEDAETERQ